MNHVCFAKDLADRHGDAHAHKIVGSLIHVPGHFGRWYQAAFQWLKKHRPLPSSELESV